MRMMDHQAGAPAVRRVHLADFLANIHPEPQAEFGTAVPLRQQYARQPGIEKFLRRYFGDRAVFLGLIGALADCRKQGTHFLKYRLGSGRRLGGCEHVGHFYLLLDRTLVVRIAGEAHGDPAAAGVSVGAVNADMNTAGMDVAEQLLQRVAVKQGHGAGANV